MTSCSVSSSIYVPFANSNLSVKETYIFGKVLKVVEHVEPVEVDGARRHRVVRESQRLSQLEDKPVDNGIINSLNAKLQEGYDKHLVYWFE